MLRCDRRLAGVRHLHAHFDEYPLWTTVVAARYAGRTYSYTMHTVTDVVGAGFLARGASFIGTVSEFAERRLFGPMGIEVKGWARDPQGVHVGGNNLSLTPRDMARFGQLFLQGGRWRGRQLVPASWASSARETNPFVLMALPP